MKKLSPAALNNTFETSMATIPMDVIVSCIFPRLPVKSLIRFKSVSKSWRTIISSPEFIHLHHHHALSSDANRLFVLVDWVSEGFHIHELDSPLSPSLYWYNPECGPRSIIAYCEFFLLINFYGSLGRVLVNPSTGRYYKIPYPPYKINEDVCYGIYLDDANNDCKVVNITQKRGLWSFENEETNIEVMVYSLRTNNWRLTERSLDKCYRIVRSVSDTVIGHLLHIIFELNTNTAKKRIGCFDILAEKWTNDVPFPHINDLELTTCKLSVLDGLLSVTTADCNVWVMKEYGVKDSWFKLMNYLDLDLNPIAYRRKGSRHEVLCRRRHKADYIWYDVREKKATMTIIESNYYGYICKGSLVDFPGGRNMKLHNTMNDNDCCHRLESKLRVERQKPSRSSGLFK